MMANWNEGLLIKAIDALAGCIIDTHKPEPLVRLPSGAWVRPSDVSFVTHDSLYLKGGRDRLVRLHGTTADGAAAIINGEKP